MVSKSTDANGVRDNESYCSNVRRGLTGYGWPGIFFTACAVVARGYGRARIGTEVGHRRDECRVGEARIKEVRRSFALRVKDDDDFINNRHSTRNAKRRSRDSSCKDNLIATVGSMSVACTTNVHTLFCKVRAAGIFIATMTAIEPVRCTTVEAS